MSIIRDFIEHYRISSEVQENIEDFKTDVTILNGYDEVYYYDINDDNNYVMIVDKFTKNGVRYAREITTRDESFNIISIVYEYDDGRKTRTDTYTYGVGLIDEAPVRIESVESDTSVTWQTPTPSTGWPSYGVAPGSGTGGSGTGGSGITTWVTTNDFTYTPGGVMTPNTGYLIDARQWSLEFWLPTVVEVGDIITVSDAYGGTTPSGHWINIQAREGVTIGGATAILNPPYSAYANKNYYILKNPPLSVTLVYAATNHWSVI